MAHQLSTAANVWLYLSIQLYPASNRNMQFIKSCANWFYEYVLDRRDSGAFHTGLCIRIRYGSGFQTQKLFCLHTASIWIWAACCAAWQCSGTVRQIESSSAMRIVCMPCGAHTTPHWIQIGDPDQGSQCPSGKPQCVYMIQCNNCVPSITKEI